MGQELDWDVKGDVEARQELERVRRRRTFLKTIGSAGAVTWVAPKVAVAAAPAGLSPAALPVDEIYLAASSAPQYCVYQIVKLNADPPGQNCPFSLLDEVCIDCPDGGDCLGHASVGNRTFKLYDDATKTTLICSGEWVVKNTMVVVNGQVVQADCEDCPVGGTTGYEFI